MDPLEAQFQRFVDQADKVAVPDQATKKAMTEAGAKVLVDALKMLHRYLSARKKSTVI